MVGVSYENVSEVHFGAIGQNISKPYRLSTLRISSGLMAIWVVPRIYTSSLSWDGVFLLKPLRGNLA